MRTKISALFRWLFMGEIAKADVRPPTTAAPAVSAEAAKYGKFDFARGPLR